MEKKEWYLSRWLVLYRCALEKVFQKQHIYSLQNSKKGLRYFCKIIYKRGLIWQGEMKKRILQNLKL